MQTFTLIFLIALVLTTLTQVWLAARHIRHVRTHQDKVPDEFATQINLTDHRKAAEYTCAKTRISYPSIVLHGVLLLVLTLGGGLNALSGFWANWTSDPLIHGMGLIISTFVIMSLVDLPLSYYRTFVIEERFGFN